MGRAPPQKAIVEGLPIERAKVDGKRASVQSSPRPTLNSIAVQQQAPSGHTKNPSRAHFIRQLEEWIDGNQVRSAAHTGDDVGFVETFYEACLNVFQHLWEHIIGSETPFNSKQKTILRESLGRMVLWSDSLGHGQLDSILERSDNLRESVLECLVGIAEIIVKKFTPLLSIGTGNPRLLEEIKELTFMNEKARLMSSEDYDSDLESTYSDEDETGGQIPKFPFLQDIATFSECLMDLLPGLERSSRVHQQTPMNYSDPSPVFQVSEPASPFVSLVLDRFRKASPRLAQRLGEANWQRYVRIRAQTGATDEDEHARPDSVIPCSVFTPVSLFRDSGLGTTVAAPSNYATSTASHTSLVSSLADVNKDSLRVPDEPPEVALGKPFTCAVCGHKLYHIKNRIDWKIHVYADLQPYICTWPDCKAELMTFATRKQWASHEFEQHRVERFWRCQECSAELPSLEYWRNHIFKAHPNAVPSRSRLGVSAQLAENSRLDVADMSCPLCLKKLGPSRRAFATHVGKHMEQLALAALPKEVSDESESDNVSIRTECLESRQIGDGLSSKSQGKSEFRLSSAHQYPSPYDYKSLHIEYSSAGGLCTEQEFSQKLQALEQQSVTRGQEVLTDAISRESPYRAASFFALEKHKPQKFCCSFCGAQPQGKHDLRRHLANKHISEPPLNSMMMADIISEQWDPDAAAIIKCICGFQEDDQGMVVCEQCKTSQHSVCYYYRGGGMPFYSKPNHKCADCEPRELDAKGATERMNSGRQQGFGMQHVIASTIMQESLFQPDPYFDYAQEKHLSDQNSDAFIGAQGENRSALKEGPPQFEVFSSSSEYSDHLRQLNLDKQQNKKRFPNLPDFKLEFMSVEQDRELFPELSDYHVQLELLEQQNRKRLRMARQEHHQEAATGSIETPATLGASRHPPTMRTVFNPTPPLDNDQIEHTGLEPQSMAIPDYEMHLQLLEQQNKKRLRMARQEQHQEAATGSVGTPATLGASRLPPPIPVFLHPTPPLDNDQIEHTGLEPPLPSPGFYPFFRCND